MSLNYREKLTKTINTDDLYNEALKTELEYTRDIYKAKEIEFENEKQKTAQELAAEQKAKEDAEVARKREVERADSIMKAAEIAAQSYADNEQGLINKLDTLRSKNEHSEEMSRLTSNFYKALAEIDDNEADAVCKRLNYGITNKKYAKNTLIDKFESDDNNGKQKIIDAIQCENALKAISQMDNKQAKAVCDIINLGVNKNKEAKATLKNHFETTDNAGKQKIIDAIHRVKTFYNTIDNMSDDQAKAVCDILKLGVNKDKEAKATLKNHFETTDNTGKQQAIDAVKA